MLTLVLFAAWAATPAAAPPDPPLAPTPPAPAVRPWACDRATLLSGALCTFEGKTAPQPVTPESRAETARAAGVLLSELCQQVALAGTGIDRVVLERCQRAQPALTQVCGDGARRLLDDDGRFNPGHAPCYAALRGAVADGQQLALQSEGCCACALSRCGVARDACTRRLADEQPLDGVCRERCATACAAHTLAHPAATTTKRSAP